MKKTLIALAAVAVAGAASADVSLSGRMDLGISNDGSTTSFAQSGNTTNRITLAGSEDLGGGLKASFAVETGLDVNGDTATTFGNRGASVSISGDFGTVTLGGSQLSAGLLTGVSVSTQGSPNYAAGSAFAGAARIDNSLAYTGKFGGATVRLQANVAGDTTSAGVVMPLGDVTVGVATDKTTAGTGNAVGANYNFGQGKVSLHSVKSAGATTRTLVAGANFMVGAVDLAAEISKPKSGSNTTVVSANYSLSKRTGVYAYAKNATTNTTGFGLIHKF